VAVLPLSAGVAVTAVGAMALPTVTLADALPSWLRLLLALTATILRVTMYGMLLPSKSTNGTKKVRCPPAGEGMGRQEASTCSCQGAAPLSHLKAT